MLILAAERLHAAVINGVVGVPVDWKTPGLQSQ